MVPHKDYAGTVGDVMDSDGAGGDGNERGDEGGDEEMRWE